MKTNRFKIFIACATFTSIMNAQIKVFTGGNTSIGATTTPVTNCKLQVVGGNAIFMSSNAAPTSSPLIFSSNTWGSINQPDYSWYGDVKTGIFHPALYTIGISINGAEKFRFNNSGQFVSSNTVTTNVSTPDFSWNNDANTGFYHPGTDLLGFVTNGTERLRVTSNGNFLLGGTSDYGPKMVAYGNSQQLVFETWATHTANYGYAQVSNVNLSLTKGLAVVYNGTEKFTARGDGAVYCALGYYTYSDQTLKENIDTIESALNKVLRLHGVNYNYKAESLNPNAMQGTVLPTEAPRRQMGLLAQEVELVVPEVVSTTEKGIKAVAYQNLVPLLIEAIKEQNTKINQLETDLTNCCQKRVNPSGTNNRTISPIENSNVETNNWLAQNKPNPFSKETLIEYNVIQEGKGSILIFDMNGKLLKTIPVKIPGKGSITITANDLPAGMYYYTLVVNDNEVDTKKMILTE